LIGCDRGFIAQHLAMRSDVLVAANVEVDGVWLWTANISLRETRTPFSYTSSTLMREPGMRPSK
jgi:hypothetical protein